MTTDDLLADLKALRDLLSTPERWTQREPARDAVGWPCEPRSPHAVCWCLTGGITKVAAGVARRRAPMYLALGRHLRRKLPRWTLVVFNDDSTYDEVIDLIDGTIKEVSAECS